MIRRPPRSTLDRSSAASDVYKRQDLIIFDEAHKMSATVWGSEVKKTKRYQMAEELGTHTRNLLMMTATPHSGKEEQFLSLIHISEPTRPY